MNFLTQAFTRGFFRNPDVRPAKLKITRFTLPPKPAPRSGMDEYNPFENGAGGPKSV